MAHSLSAKKRVRQNEKRRAINRARKSSIKTQIKHFEDALASGDLKAAAEQFRLTAKRLDKVASTTTMHKKTKAYLAHHQYFVPWVFLCLLKHRDRLIVLLVVNEAQAIFVFCLEVGRIVFDAKPVVFQFRLVQLPDQAGVL